MKLAYALFSERNLPHIQPPGATLFITFRLVGSLPKWVFEELQAEQMRAAHRIEQIGDARLRSAEIYVEHKRQFGRYDAYLDQAEDSPLWLQNLEVAATVADSMQHFNRKRYDLLAYCIMPNHVHLLLRPLQLPDGKYHSLRSIMHSIKGFSANEANKIVGRTGQFWQHESYDHVVRDQRELNNIIRYICHNPVKAGLVDSAEKWPWTFP